MVEEKLSLGCYPLKRYIYVYILYYSNTYFLQGYHPIDSLCIFFYEYAITANINESQLYLRLSPTKAIN